MQRITTARILDFDHVSTKTCEVRSREGTGDQLTELQHLDAGEPGRSILDPSQRQSTTA